MSDLRERFEAVSEIKDILKNNDELRYSPEQLRYVNHRVFQDAETGYINGAWFMFQELNK